MDMTMVLGGITLPKFGDLKRVLKPNETDRRTLGGTLFTDFVNNNRSWVLSWKNIKYADYQVIETLYLQQYRNYVYPTFECAAYGINCKVKINIAEQNIKANSALLQNFSFTIQEQQAIS